MWQRRTRWLICSGLALILAGLGVLGWMGWEFWGTNMVSHRHQQAAVRQLRVGWAHSEGPVRTPWGEASAIIRIPRFGAGYEVPVLEGTSASVLAAGFGHYSGTAGPGQVGNYALAGHRITHGEPLRHMPDLRAGDEVIVETAQATYTYRLTSAGAQLVVPFTDTWVLAPLPVDPIAGGVEPVQRPGQRLLTLTTCAELFHTSNRMVAFGVLVSTTKT